MLNYFICDAASTCKVSKFKIWRFAWSNRSYDVITRTTYAYVYSHFSLVTARSQMYEVDSCVRGHHVFRGIWNPMIGEQLVYDLRLS